MSERLSSEDLEGILANNESSASRRAFATTTEVASMVRELIAHRLTEEEREHLRDMIHALNTNAEYWWGKEVARDYVAKAAALTKVLGGGE